MTASGGGPEDLVRGVLEGDARAIGRAISEVERNAALRSGDPAAHLPEDRPRAHPRHHGAARGREVHARAAARPGLPQDRAPRGHRRRRSVLAVHGRGHPRRPHPHVRDLHGPGRLHPLDGHARRARRPLARDQRRRGRARRRGLRPHPHRDGRRGAGRGRHRARGGHGRRRARARPGRRHPGDQGRDPRDRGRLRRQQGRARRLRPGRGGALDDARLRGASALETADRQDVGADRIGGRRSRRRPRRPRRAPRGLRRRHASAPPASAVAPGRPARRPLPPRRGGPRSGTGRAGARPCARWPTGARIRTRPRTASSTDLVRDARETAARSSP